MTVLFVDVSGLTSISEKFDPEEVHQLMNRSFELMLDEVHLYEGTVNQFLGDGIMALFGAPIAHEDHAQRAVHAALGIQRVLKGYREELQRTRGIDFRCRMGLNTGLVVVAGIGDNLRMDYTAVGNTTNLAARMQQMAEPGQILIAEDTHKGVSGYFITHDLGEVAVKGKDHAVRAYRVERARELQSRTDVGAERGLTPFVGREQELASLRNRFLEAKAGQGQVVMLMGEPGIGKSRLLLEFRRRLAGATAQLPLTPVSRAGQAPAIPHQERGNSLSDGHVSSPLAEKDKGEGRERLPEGESLTWQTGRCISFGRQIAYLPIIDLLKQNFRVEEGDDEAAIIAKVERSLTALGEELRPS